ncbi:hypothetical protein [Microbacterium sp. LWH11-1.2]|uniref:hypothetical protein n=1 Tax=Microbacterium sp. LWH11-1.2 TaxID=3135258 RepID=UPI0031398B06
MVTYLDSHSVSAEYAFWQMEEQKVRAFLLTTNRGMDAWLSDQWDAAEVRANEIFDPEAHDGGLVAEIYEDRIGLWPTDYFWQLSSAVVKDAVALYEIFLETLANQVLGRAGHRLSTLDTEDSWRWPEYKSFYTHYVGVDVASDDIESVLWIRNKLAHLRDGLRTETGRAEFASHVEQLGLDGPETAEEQPLGLVDHAPYMTHGVFLTQLQTWRLLDLIAVQVGKVALAAFPFIYGRQTSAHLEALRLGTPLAAPDLTVKQVQKYFVR